MDLKIRKIVRTFQSEFPVIKSARDGLTHHAARLLKRPHEFDFRALTLLPDSLGGCYIDAGANQGQSIESMLLFKPRARIVSFEPNPQLAAKLTRRYRGNDSIIVVASGLSDAVERCTLYVPAYKGFVYDGLASLDREAAAAWINADTVLGFNPAKLVVTEQTCEISTLDSYELVPIFIKIDVQGYEYNVLNGGRETLRRCEPILLVEVYRSDPRTVALAESLGYEEYGFDGNAFRKGPPLRGPNSFLMTPSRLRSLKTSALPRAQSVRS